MFSQLEKQFAEKDGITKTLKASDQMEWVRRMNAIRAQATEIVNNKLFHPQLGVKTLLDGGRRRTKNLYGVVKRTVPAGQVRQ